jgi:hypothetical protein
VTRPQGALGVSCVNCRTVLSLEYQPDGPAEPYRWQAWSCPICNWSNSLNLAGHIVRIVTPES